MYKFKVEQNTIKAVVESVTPFNTKKNCIQFSVGARVAQEDRLPCIATIVSGGNMISKGFMAIFEGEAPKGMFNVLANDFINYANALLAYHEDISFSVNDTALELSAGCNAKIPLALIAEAEPALSYSNLDTLAVFQLNTSAFNDFARKGCFLYDESDQRQIADRVTIMCDFTGDCTLMGCSTDGYSFAKASLVCGKSDDGKPNFVIRPGLALINLKKKVSTLTGTDKELLGDAIQVAEKEFFDSKGKKKEALDQLTAKEHINLDELTFAIPVKSFQLLKGIVKGTKRFQLMITNMYCVVLTIDTVGVFTLGASVPTFFNNIGQFTNPAPVAEIVVNKQTVMNGLSLLSISANSGGKEPKPLHMSIEKDTLSMHFDGSDVIASLIGSAGALNSFSMYMRTSLLQKIIGSLDNGTIYIAFRGPSLPLAIRNGSLEDESNSIALVLPTRAPKVADDESEETDKSEDITSGETMDEE